MGQGAVRQADDVGECWGGEEGVPDAPADNAGRAENDGDVFLIWRHSDNGTPWFEREIEN